MHSGRITSEFLQDKLSVSFDEHTAEFEQLIVRVGHSKVFSKGSRADWGNHALAGGQLGRASYPRNPVLCSGRIHSQARVFEKLPTMARG